MTVTALGSRHLADDSRLRTAAGQSGGGKHVDEVRVHSTDGVHAQSARCSRRHDSLPSVHVDTGVAGDGGGVVLGAFASLDLQGDLG